MAAAVRIVVGPTGSGKTSRLLAGYRRQAQAALGSALWLAPSGRAAADVRRRLFGAKDRSLRPAILGLQLLSMDDFAGELIRHGEPTVRPLPETDRRLIVAELVAECAQREELSYFASIAETPGFAESAIGLLDELAGRGATPEGFDEACERAGGAGAGRRKKLRQCAHLFRRYQRRIAREHALDPEARLRRAARLIRQGRARPFDRARSVFIDGFNNFTPGEGLLVRELCGWAEGVWLSLPGDEADGTAECFAASRRVLDWVRELGPDVSVVWLPPAAASSRPAGLSHLERSLFRGGHGAGAVEKDGEGLRLIEAPGELGEARMVARQIVRLLREGIAANSIVVTGRDLGSGFGLLHEVFDEYGIPAEVEGAGSLLANPAVATLLRALRLPDEGWPFAGVTALLRSNYFDPEWRECIEEPELPLEAEGLLRLLGEPRGREAYLRAVEVWSETPPVGLEDEQADEPRRQRKARLARRCRPFLNRFFQAWDRFPPSAPLGGFIQWLRRFADDIGLMRSARAAAPDIRAVDRLWDELHRWERRRQGHPAAGRPLSRGQFIRLLGTLASARLLPHSPAGPGRVRVVPAEQARQLEADYLFVIGLGEGSFPDLSAPTSLLDDGDRAALREAGLDFPAADDRLAAEMLLFYELVSLPRRQLVLSFAAVDAKGQPMLASSFLRAARDCFAEGAIPTDRQVMLVEGLNTREPLSDPERRVRWAIHQRDFPARPAPVWAAGLAGDLLDNLRDAADVCRARFRSDSFGPFDGWLAAPAVREELDARFHRERVFSPTALEAYVACPFRFFLEHVLRLEMLEEPGETVEQTRRGAAVHRALARFHGRVRDRHPELLDGVAIPDAVGAELLDEIDRAVGEYAARAPSPASAVLWRLEGERLKRLARKYSAHWSGFVEPWRERGAVPLPTHLEADFGLKPAEPDAPMAPPLTIAVGDVEVRVGGRIDRVDVAEIAGGLGFWVIDYKTGRPEYYTGRDLTRFEKLQLPLYALAVERVFFADRPARPLGLAYWMVTHTGPKPVLPGGGKQALKWLASAEHWERFRGQLEAWVAALVSRIRQGLFPLAPRSDQCTATCPYGEVCRINQSRSTGKVWDLALPTAPGGKEADEPG